MTNIVASITSPGCISCNLLHLNHLVQQQKIIANGILNAITNYKKSPTHRKTLVFIKNKFQGLQILWLKFQRWDNHIRRYYNTSEVQHGYFQQELYSLVHEKYTLACARMNRDKKKCLWLQLL
ncbi:hypothetical protein KR044_007488 [Drosophila immigrans]|nr:hypothetical protein KR044_007488 [Drosophila immigrans]